MRTCTEPCARGFNRCCKDCQIEEFCSVKCSYQVCDHEEQKPRSKKNRIAQKFRTVYILLAMLIALTITASIIIISQLDKITVLSEDILNTEQLANQEQKDVVSEDFAPCGYTLTAEERELIERVVSAEARGEDLQGQMAVAQTILDRSELWNMTVTEVLTAPDQYAKPYQGEISDATKLAVANVFDGGIRVFQEPVTHFYTGATPYWADEKVNRGSIGRHTFLY